MKSPPGNLRGLLRGKRNAEMVVHEARHTAAARCPCQKADLKQVHNEETPVGKMLIKLAENEYTLSSEESRAYWSRILCEASSEIEDTQGLLAILKSPDLSVAHTAARKALRIIDFINYGPKIE